MLNVVSPLNYVFRQHMEEGKHVEDCLQVEWMFPTSRPISVVAGRAVVFGLAS
jgi:hypothetical protein